MAWKEARGSARVAVATSRHLAHSDDAKQRRDEASHTTAAHGVRRGRVLAGAGAGVLVLALIAFLVLRGGGSSEPVAGPAPQTPDPTASAPAPTPAELLKTSVPTGRWRVDIGHGSQTTRGGKVSSIKQHDHNIWTFPAAACTDEQCSGAIKSSSGRKFPFVWDGRTLLVDHKITEHRYPKQACIDLDTGAELPITESADQLTYHYRFSPFTGSPTSMRSKQSVHITYEFFGTCHPQPYDLVSYTYEWTMAALEGT